MQARLPCFLGAAPLSRLSDRLLCRYEEYCMDEFPSGTNAIVAVLSYTGEQYP